MPINTRDQLPLESLRDLLGIVRAMYAAWCEAGAGPIELDELLEVGKQLRTALDLASKTKPGTLGHRAAWRHAEAATERLGKLVDHRSSTQELVEAASRRALAGKPAPKPTDPTAREQKAAHRRSRG